MMGTAGPMLRTVACRTSPASGTHAAVSASTMPPAIVAVAGDATRKRHAITWVAFAACPPDGCISLTKPDATPAPFRERYCSAEIPASCSRHQWSAIDTSPELVAASNLAAATSPHQAANPTTYCTGPTVVPPVSLTSKITVGGIIMSCCTNGAGR